MCQALSITADVAELSECFQLDQVLFHTPERSELNPTESIAAIRNADGKRVLDEFRWGLMPYWAKDSVRMDSRTMLWKPSFDRMIKQQRCVVPCTGFYVSPAEGKKTPRLKVTMSSGSAFGIAGLYDVFRTSSGEELRTCTILMTQANSLISPFSRQMPAILESELVDRWLELEEQEGSDPYRLHDMLRPMAAARMVSVPMPPLGSEAVSSYEAPRPKLI